MKERPQKPPERIVKEELYRIIWGIPLEMAEKVIECNRGELAQEYQRRIDYLQDVIDGKTEL